jgi:murein DD-endopeptidase MepM/ murein hydrolase activator NlpD
MTRLPVDGNGKTTPHGAYGYIRKDPSDGSCGVGGYPCRHPGVDLVAPAGAPVFAPEDGVIVEAVAGKGLSSTLPRPYRGYGPGVVVLRGESGAFHLLAHLEPDELRRRYADRRDPAERVLDFLVSKDRTKRVQRGEVIAQASGVGHVHWEVRKLTKLGGAGDPMAWYWRRRAGGASGGLLMAAVVALALAMERKNRRKR